MCCSVVEGREGVFPLTQSSVTSLRYHKIFTGLKSSFYTFCYFNLVSQSKVYATFWTWLIRTNPFVIFFEATVFSFPMKISISMHEVNVNKIEKGA